MRSTMKPKNKPIFLEHQQPMTYKHKRLTLSSIVIIVIALSVVALVASFGWVSFRATYSRVGRDSSMATSNVGAQPGQVKNPTTTTGLHVKGEELFQRSLQVELTRRLQQLPKFGQIQPISDPVDQAEFPFLFVEIARKDLFWTPVYGRADLEIKIAYASNGDVSFRHSEPPAFHNENQAPSIKRSGQYQFTDVSWGIMSLPGYHDYLASQVATAILADLQN
jgi:hypothetical protein